MKYTYNMDDLSSRYLGVDAGGTHTRVLIADAHGAAIASSVGDGANLWSSGTSVAAVIHEALMKALGDVDTSTITHGVIAAAGGTATRAAAVSTLLEMWNQAGLPGTPDVIPDVLAAYAAGTTAPSGIVLAAGTGSIAARVSDWQIDRRAGGHGWLVGDEGSAVWLGIEAVRAALRSMDGRGPTTTLIDAVVQEFDLTDIRELDRGSEIVASVYSNPPVHFGRLAPLVIEHCRNGDETARALVEQAADHLTASAIAASGGTEPHVLVLAGSMVTKADAVASRVRERIAATWPDTHIATAVDGAAGAIAIAIREHTGTAVDPEVLARLRNDSVTPS